MATPEGVLTPDVSGTVATSGSIPAGSSPAPATADSQSSADVKPQSVQGEQTQTQESDPFEGIPALEQLQQEAEKGVPYAKGLAQLRSAFEPLKTQFGELSEKYKVFEPVADRFQNSEELQKAIELNDKLFGFERDESGQLIPATEAFAQDIATRDPVIADFLAADLMNGLTRTDDGREVPRIDLALEEMARDPQRRATALKILGGVEPSSIAPTWQPSEAELKAILKDPDNPTKEEMELQDIYRKLPYDERESLRLNEPDFIRSQLKKEQALQRLTEQTRLAEEREARQQQQREQYVQRQAQEAGNKYVEQGFRTGMTEFANSIVERSKFIAPVDPNSDVAKQMTPEQLAATNQQVQRINTGVGKMVATITAALSHPDTSWAMADFLKEIGVDEKTITAFDGARIEYARNARDYGELNFTHSLERNGNGQSQAGLGALQSNATRAMKQMKGYGNAIAGQMLSLLNEFFEMKAGNYNATLNGAQAVRPPVSGTAYDPAKAPPVRPAGEIFLTRAEIDRQFG